MNLRTGFILILAGYCLLCGGLIVDSGFSRTARSTARSDATAGEPPSSGRGCILLQQTTDVQTLPADGNTPGPPEPQLQPAAGEYYSAVGGPKVDTVVGSVDRASNYKYRLVLESQGAAIRTATFSEYNDREHKNPQPLTFLSPAHLDGREVLPLANGGFTLVDQGRRLDLGRLSWKALDVEELEGGGAAAPFEALIVDSQDQPVLRLTKTYCVRPDTYLLEITFDIENLAGEEHEVQYALTGPVGLEREAFRQDMRKVIAGFRTPQGEVVSTGLNVKALLKAQTPEPKYLQPKNPDWAFLWAAAVNKYFAAILVPVPPEGQEYADWIARKWGIYYNPDRDRKGNTGDETIGLGLSSVPTTLGPAGEADSSRTYRFQLYLGPKDKSRFDKVELYRKLGFVHTIDFMTCCCPASVINPLAFGILAIMNWMHAFFWPHNYGIVIIILVFVMRLILHPVTKKSQVSMSKMSKLAPRAEEIKKKYGNNKAEMNKRLMELYREQGASPIMGFLPMMVQMPVWIALWSAIYTSIDLRGAAFLPFWITDLSIPDMLLRWEPVTVPLLNWQIESLNLLPLLMGVAFYLQQKLMPTQQASAATNPQLAQQQKMMSIMMPLLFPLMLYKAPSGVNLYIMSSTFAGVIEQYVIRKHIREKEEQEAKGLISATSKTGGKVKKKKPKPFYRF